MDSTDLTPYDIFQPSKKGEIVGEGGHYGLTGRIIKNLKLPKKLMNCAQNSGMITRKLELITFFARNGKLFLSK